MLLFIDRNFLHEGSFRAFGALAAEGLRVRRPGQNFATTDHNVPTRNVIVGLMPSNNPELREMVVTLERNSEEHDIRLYGLNDPQQGIVHVIGPELGITQPGITLTCGNSHTSTHGAFGAYACGIGATQLKQVLATQCLWQSKPKPMRIALEGLVGPGVCAKDVVLALIAEIGTAGATGYVIEYAGSAIRALSIEGRLTVCNMSIEAGARAGMIAPDDTTFGYLSGREFAPKGADWDRALADWRSLPSDEGAHFDSDVACVSNLAPMVSWGTNPEEVAPITAVVPDPECAGDASKREHARKALEYMRLRPRNRYPS